MTVPSSYQNSSSLVRAVSVISCSSFEPCAVFSRAEFWFGDGNIILVARDVEFRVYKGILADHSPVFDDMFSFPQPTPSTTPPLATSTGSTTDTCPFVHLTDSPEDLRHLLRVCMPKKGMFR